jgi:hypothetical protein
MRVRTALLLAALCGSATAPALGQQQQDARPKTVSVAAFKNGLGFFVRQGAAKLSNGWGTISDVPEATYGSLWLGATDRGASIDELVALYRDVPGERAAASVRELLAANAGKAATIEVGGKLYTGTILRGPARPEPASAVEPPLVGRHAALSAVGPVSVAAPAAEGDLLLMQLADGSFAAFSASDVRWASFQGSPVTSVPSVGRTRALRFRMKGAGESANLTMGYLRKGLGWSPSYLVSIEDDTTARITMQAVLVNDAEDLTDADVFFVVGVPNFAFSEVMSPMTLQQSLAEFMSGLQQGGQTGFRVGPLTNVMTQSVAAYDPSSSPGPAGVTVAELGGAPEEDLFLYSRPRVTLASGERATYVVFSGDIAYEHVYEWTIPDLARVDAYGRTRSDEFDESDRVWHSLRLANSLAFPWTTAPAMVVSGQKPLAQNTLDYTPKGAKGLLKLTVATDVQTSKQELEVGRKPEFTRIRSTTYDEVTVEGTLRVRNFKGRAVTLTVRKTVTGEVLVASDGGAVTKLAEAINSVNPRSRLAWEVPLAAGQEKVITYRYKILVAT